MNKRDLNKESLAYHENGRQGKIEVVSTKPCATQYDLSLAYTPGVAAPCNAIHANAEDAYKYTAKSNLVAVVTNGTAVLGLGNIGALAGKPVMEGKGILFKRFADIDVFDIELATENVDDIVKTCQLLEPTFGGINLEDIKAPECFAIEEQLKKTMNIPIFHDDQHGTAIIGGAALINALLVVGKKIDTVKVVINGAGASGLAIANLIVHLGVKKSNLIVCDTKGIIYKGRKEGMNKYKENFATDTDKRTLTDAVNGCDVLYGLSAKGAFSDAMIKSMAKNPVIFAMANPDPEITPEEVKKIRTDALIATGRSDYPNQVNNVLCFPFLFRGALDVRSKVINEEMKVAASNALAELARETVPASVLRAYKMDKIEFGREYILPKPFDPRVAVKVSVAVAKAAMESGVAQKPIKDFDKYAEQVDVRLNPSRRLVHTVMKKAKSNKVKIGFSYADKPSVLQAAQMTAAQKIGNPVLVGNKAAIEQTAKAINVDISKMEIIDPETYTHTERFIKEFHEQFWRSGITASKAKSEIVNCGTHFAACLLDDGAVDALVAYAPHSLEETIVSLADVIDLHEDFCSVSQAVVMSSRDHDFIMSDPRLYSGPDAESLAEIALQTVDTAELFGMSPKVALIANSNFSFPETDESDDIRMALELVKTSRPKLTIDGDMKFFTATDPNSAAVYPHSEIQGDANVFVFSNASAACAAIGALRQFGGFHVSARVISGFEKPIQIAESSTDIEDIATLAAVAAASVEK